jgi:hypothetical protein
MKTSKTQHKSNKYIASLLENIEDKDSMIDMVNGFSGLSTRLKTVLINWADGDVKFVGQKPIYYDAKKTKGDLVNATISGELWEARNFGQKCYNELTEWLEIKVFKKSPNGHRVCPSCGCLLEAQTYSAWYCRKQTKNKRWQ